MSETEAHKYALNGDLSNLEKHLNSKPNDINVKESVS